MNASQIFVVLFSQGNLREHSIIDKEEKHEDLKVKSFHWLCGSGFAWLGVDLFRL